MGHTPELLTSVELEMMNILWKLGEGSVRDVQAKLPQERKLAYTSVSTILRILEKKGILSGRKQKQGRGHTYVPLINKSSYESKSLDSLVENVFEGAPLGLVKRLIEDKKISDHELHELQKLIQKMDSNA